MQDQIDSLVWQAVFADTEQKRALARLQIWQQAQSAGVLASSIHELYEARGRGQVLSNFTVPAMNLRGMTYDLARSIFAAAVKLRVGALIFELARSEMQYTDQSPVVYTPVIMAAALKEGWTGPLFLQCDHFQAKAAEPGVAKDGELDAIKSLIGEALGAGMYNVDIDMSTLVDLSAPTESEQQVANIRHTLELTEFVRRLEPAGVTVSLGCEIGHIGGRNSTMADFEAFMSGYTAGLGEGLIGVSKMSIQTGTSHGGVVNADGSLASVAVDFELLRNVSRAGREQYGMGGSVQHGASTLPHDLYHKFPEAETLEIHFATGLQNMIMDHPAFPAELLSEIYSWIDTDMAAERGADQTLEQFHYTQRKKAWGAFKKQTWSIPEANREELRNMLHSHFETVFGELGVSDTMELVRSNVSAMRQTKNALDFTTKAKVKAETVAGLAD